MHQWRAVQDESTLMPSMQYFGKCAVNNWKYCISSYCLAAWGSILFCNKLKLIILYTCVYINSFVFY